jgi:hypothetical protein
LGSSASHCKPVYGKARYYLACPSSSSTPDRAYSGLNYYAGSYYISVTMSQGYLTMPPIFQPSVGTSNSSSSGASPDQDFIEDYLEIRGSAYWNPAIEVHRLSMVGPARMPSHNSSSRYPTINGSEASDTQIKQHSHSEYEFGLQCRSTPDHHGINLAHGPSRLPTSSFGPARG